MYVAFYAIYLRRIQLWQFYQFHRLNELINRNIYLVLKLLDEFRIISEHQLKKNIVFNVFLNLYYKICPKIITTHRVYFEKYMKHRKFKMLFSYNKITHDFNVCPLCFVSMPSGCPAGLAWLCRRMRSVNVALSCDLP
jgi:hypothetical protein